MNFFLVLRPERQVSPKFSQTREQLRTLAKTHNIPRGRDISDTVRNLRKAGHTV